MSQLIKLILTPKMLITFMMGFASGLPLLLIGGTLQAMMTDAGVDLGTIGLFSLAGLPYTLKFLVAPLFDRFLPPILQKNAGRRRGWILIFQILLVVSISCLGLLDPVNMLVMIAILACVIGLFSALQDIVIDAYRRELLESRELGLGSSLYVNGYRIAMLLTGGGALVLADMYSWKIVYILMGISMFAGIVTTILAYENTDQIKPPKTLKDAVIEPFVEYWNRRNAFLILAFILLYKIGDTMAAAMTTPFILKMGFSKTEMGAIVKLFGFWATISGGIIGGVLILKMGIRRSLWVFGFLQAISTFGFSLMALLEKSNAVLASVIAFENLASGMGTAAYAAFMASITDKRYTATQYALLTSLMGIPRVFLSAPTGYLVQSVGWFQFFAICTVIALPGLLLMRPIAHSMVESEY